MTLIKAVNTPEVAFKSSIQAYYKKFNTEQTNVWHGTESKHKHLMHDMAHVNMTQLLNAHFMFTEIYAV